MTCQRCKDSGWLIGSWQRCVCVHLAIVAEAMAAQADTKPLGTKHRREDES